MMRRLFAVLAVLAAESLCAAPSATSGVRRADFRIRDPFVLVDGGRYYLYESKPWFGGRGVAVRESADLERWSEATPVLTLPPEMDCTAVWAPEVHRYNGAYWLFVTLSQSTNAFCVAALSPDADPKNLTPRGTWVFRADSPRGPFRAVKDGSVPPRELMTLDGTLHVEDGRPYMVYCHEWCQLANGTIEYAPLTDDLSAFVSAPRRLLDARSAMEGAARVTDGCFLYRSEKSGRLYLIWSNFIEGHGYCVLVRSSANGRLAGPWTKDEILYGENGGHGMIFRGLDGELYLTFHGPEKPEQERMRLVRLEDDGQQLRVREVLDEKRAAHGSGARTYCNPLSLPDYPRGAFAQKDTISDALGDPALLSRQGAFREAGDPAVIVEKGVWYLYVSGVMAGCWKSADHGATWERVDVGLPEFAFGYAPTVVGFRGKFLVCGGWGSGGTVWRGDSPEGPFAPVGRMALPEGEGVPGWADPMLFADGDRLYLYWGCSPTSGIWGCELDPENPCRAITPARRLVAYDPEGNPWERFPNKPFGFVEGAWAFRRNGSYYLVFAAGGTEHPTYATGVARATSPLGDFVLQANNPVFFSPKGAVTGTAHGSVIEDENGEWWYFYTVHASIRHQFERRIGMDRLTFDAEGNVVARSASSEPQPLSGGDAAGVDWPPVRGVWHFGGAAFDQSLETEFVPQGLPYELEYEFLRPEAVRANRVIWSDGGYDPKGGVDAGPVRYRLWLKGEAGDWGCAVDASANDRDLLVDYRETRPFRATAARLSVVGAPAGILPRVVEWTLFGERAK